MNKLQKALAIILYIFVQIFLLGMLYSMFTTYFGAINNIKLIPIGMISMLELFIVIVTIEMLKEK